MPVFRRRSLRARRRLGVSPIDVQMLESRLLLATFVVNLNSDESDLDPSDGRCDVSTVLAGDQCTLRAAIEQSNATFSTLDEIQFNLGGGGAQTITPTKELPVILDGVMIDATTQPGFSAAGVPLIQLSGQAAGTANGLTLAGVGTSLRGLAINLFDGLGILVQGGGFHKIAGNAIGTDGFGLVALPNLGGGVLVLDSSNNEVGGAGLGDRNVISGNLGNGVEVRGSNSNQNRITGNIVGLTALGDAALPNSFNGIFIANSSNNIVGGATAADRNVISGNLQNGMVIFGTNATQNRIVGNYIGTDASGSVTDPDGIPGTGDELGNGMHGVLFDIASDNTIGGATPAEANVIAGNAQSGVVLMNAAKGNIITNNFIGTDPNLIAGIGNAGHGILIQGASSNLIGVSGQGQGGPNTIMFNGADGVFVESGVENRISRNILRRNGGLGIDLAPDAPNFPQSPDPGIGANGLQNFPELISVTRTATSTSVLGTLTSTPLTMFRLEFFFSTPSDADPSGFGEGEFLLGSVDLATDALGLAPINLTFLIGVAAGDLVTATATDPLGNTSEFSAAFAATVPTVQFDATMYSVNEGAGTATVTVTRSNGAAGVVSVDVAVTDGTALDRSDYNAFTAKLNFAPGVTTQSFDVTILPDTLDEDDETINLALNMVGGATLGIPSTATISILDDDPLPSITIDDASTAEGDAGVTVLAFTVRLTPASGRDVTVLASTADDSAVAPGDYTAINSAAAIQILIPAGATEAFLTISVRGETLDELDEQFFVNLAGAVNATIGDNQAIGTILDDDLGLNVTVNSFSFAGPGSLGTLEILYEISGAAAPALEFSFFTSLDARVTAADQPRGPRQVVNDPALLAVGFHAIQFDGTPYAGSLLNLDVPFFLAGATIPPIVGVPVAEVDATDNDINYIGFFHQPGGALIIRGGDGMDRYADDPNDVITMRDAGGASFTTRFTVGDVVVPAATISEIRVLGLGGDDAITADASLQLPLNIRGGDGDDTATGGSGNDRLEGGAGDDRLGGGLGNDILTGGADNDTADFSVAANGVSVSLLTGRSRGHGKDTLATIEHVIGSIARDRIVGNALGNVLIGGPGADYILGGPGNDFIDGGDGDDTLFGNEGDDMMLGGLGDERVFCGGDGNDTMDGGGGNDQVGGDAGDDELSGGDGNDRVSGGVGNDLVTGGDGNDSLEGSAGTDLILGGLGFDFILFDLLDLPVDLGGGGNDGGKTFRV